MRWKAVLGLITLIGLMSSLNNVTATHPLSNVYQLAFQVYRKAFTLAYTRELTSDQREELERISEEQPSIVLDSIRDILGSPLEDSQDVSNGNIGVVYLNGPLNETQTRQLEVSLIEKHLYFTKQIILLMDLKASDLGVLDRSIEAQKIRYRVFQQVLNKKF